MAQQEELYFKVEEWSEPGRHERLLRVVARCSNLMIAAAAYDAAVGTYARSRIMLRDGIRVVRDTHPAPPPDYPGR